MATKYPLHHIALIQKFSEIFPLNRISFFAQLIVKQFSSVYLNAQLKPAIQSFAFIPHLNIRSINLVNAHSPTPANVIARSNFLQKKQAGNPHECKDKE